MLEIVPLTKGRFADLAVLFERGGDPKWCWCVYFRRPGLNWTNSDAAANRAGLTELAGQEPAPGLVAYREQKVVGWVSVGPRASYARLSSSKLLAPVDDQPVWSIVCFVVDRRERGKGVGRALLAAAVEYAAARGATVMEAYPVATERGRVPAASAYQGSQSMFERAGFEVVSTRRWNEASPARPIMRRTLNLPPKLQQGARPGD